MSVEPLYDRTGKIVPGIFRFDSQGAAKMLELLGRHLGAWEKDNIQSRPQISFVEVIRPELPGSSPGSPGEIVEGESKMLPPSGDTVP